MFRVLHLVKRFSAVKPSKGFQALNNKQIQQEVLGYGNPKLDALVEVLLSLTNRQTQYLNLLLTERSLKNNQSILVNKMINFKGYKVDPIQHFYQQQWIKAEWKDTNLLQFILSEEIQQASDKIAEEVVKENYDVELTSLDAAQKIKIIKALREMFNLGLKEAKDFADKAPSMLKKNMKRQEAEKLKKDLQAAGCVITLK